MYSEERETVNHHMYIHKFMVLLSSSESSNSGQNYMQSATPILLGRCAAIREAVAHCTL